MESKNLSPSEVAAELGVGCGTVRRWIRAGRLPSFRIPGTATVRVPREALERLREAALADVPGKK